MKEKIPKDCRRCNRAFTVLPSRRHKVFCSKECAWQDLKEHPKPCKKKKPFICPICKEIFYGYSNKQRGRPRVFCSRKCMGIGTRGPTIFLPWYKRLFNKLIGR